MSDSKEFRAALAAAVGGEREAFDRLIGLSSTRLTIFVRSRVRPELRQRLDVEALVTETFACAFESLARFNHASARDGEVEDRWRAWLAGIARNVVLKAVGSLGRVHALEIDTQSSKLVDSGTSPSRTLRREERFDRLEEALGGLQDDYRQVIRLCRIDGLSVRDAAERIGRSEAATKKLVWRALKALQQRFGETESLRLPGRRFSNLPAGDTDGT